MIYTVWNSNVIGYETGIQLSGASSADYHILRLKLYWGRHRLIMPHCRFLERLKKRHNRK